MNKLLLGLVVGLAAGAAGFWLLTRPSGPAPKEVPKEEAHEAPFLHHGTNGETFLKLSTDVQARMGLKAAALATAQLKPEVKGYGRILDPAPLAALLAERASARAALEASTREYDRLKLLRGQNQNASARALEAAEAAMKRDQVQLDATTPRLLLGWGKAIAERVDQPQFLPALVAQEAALARVDLPLNQALKAMPTGGRLAALTAPEVFSEAEPLGAAPAADPQMQGQGFLFLVPHRFPPPGAGIIAWLQVPGAAESGVVVPREALLQHAGAQFVYLQTGGETFRRVSLGAARLLGEGWFTAEGLRPGDRVVVVGAQQLLSEELKGAGGE